jgi:DNA-binding MarR family transcriptional regulator
LEAFLLKEPIPLSPEEKVFQSQPRFSILYLLFLKRKIGFLELKKLLGLTPGNLDHHIKKLDQVGLVKIRRIISWRPLVLIEITPLGSDAFRNYLLKLKNLLAGIPHSLLQDD